MFGVGCCGCVADERNSAVILQDHISLASSVCGWCADTWLVSGCTAWCAELPWQLYILKHLGIASLVLCPDAVLAMRLA